MKLISSPPARKNLVYTVLFDSPGSETYRFLGKMLVSSLLRTFFTGDILVFRNSPAPLFLVERKCLDELYLETPEMFGQERADYAWCWKYRVAELIENPEQYDKILFLDADCLALRNIDHLLEGDWDLRYQPERHRSMDSRNFNAFLTDEEMAMARDREGANSGTLAVRGAVFHEVMRQWQEIDESEPLRPSGFRDQASWNALLLRAGRGSVPPWKSEPFPAGEIMFPGSLDPDFSQYRQAALTHNIFSDSQEKTEFSFGLYMRTFFCDPTGLFLSLLEM